MEWDLVGSLCQDGQFVSSGQFTLDLARQAQLTRDYQLSDPEHFVLRAVASAVSSEASCFCVEAGQRTTTFRWDAPNPSSAALGELAIAVRAAELLGEVQLQTGPEVSLQLTRRGWRAGSRAKRSTQLLRQRAAYAPLRFEPPLPIPRHRAPLAVLFGEPPWSLELEVFQQAPLFRYGDGLPTSFAQLRDDYDRQGFLATVSKPTSHHKAVLLEKNTEAFLRRAFANHFSWDKVPSHYRRLPEGEDYLVRLPLADGEVALRAFPTTSLRRWDQDEWLQRCQLPFGVDYIGERLLLGDAYRALSHSKAGSREARAFHIATFFVFLSRVFPGDQGLQQAYARDGILRTLLDPSRRLHFSLQQGQLTASELREMAENVQFPLRLGGSVDLLTLAEQGGHWPIFDPNSPRALMADGLTGGRLLELLAPHFRVQDGGWAGCSRACYALLQQPNPVLALLTTPECDACKALQGLADLEPAIRTVERLPLPDMDQVLRQARLEMGWGRWMSSYYLLLGMLGSLQDFRLALERIGLTREKLIDILPQWAEQENLRDLGQDESAFDGDLHRLWYAKQAYCHLWVRDFTGALLWARESTRDFARHADSWDLMGLVHSLRGSMSEAMQCFDKSLLLKGPFPAHLDGHLEALRAEGRLQEARDLARRSVTKLNPVVAASLSEEPEEALRLCAEVHEPPSVYEVCADALARLGRSAEARENYLRFLQVRPDQLLEPDLEERQFRARAWLQDNRQ